VLATRNEIAGAAELVGWAANAAVTGTVRDMHRGISDRVFDAVGTAAGPTRAVHDQISSLVYGSVRLGLGAGAGAVAAAARLVGGNRDQRPLTRSPAGGLVVSAVNGLFGDRLEAQGNDLAVELALRADGHDVAVEPGALAAAFPTATGRIVLFAHGLAGNEATWRLGAAQPGPDGRPQGTYGERLAAEAGWTPTYFRYNTGLPVLENGHRIAALVDELVAAWPVRVDDIALVGHSMGGLVARSAAHDAASRQAHWVERLRHVVCLGSPHHGSWLEQSIHLVAASLDIAPESRPLAAVLDLRSRGIKDLRRGKPLDDVPSVPGVAYSFLAATLSDDPGRGVGWLVGDLLVRYPSATAHTRDIEPPSPAVELVNVRHVPRLNHFQLLNNRHVADQLTTWLAPTAHQRSASTDSRID